MPSSRPTAHVFLATSLDGCIARRDGGIDWLEPMQRDGFDYGFTAFFAAVDTILLGRRTYDTALGFGDWPYRGKRVVVMTHRPPAARAEAQFFAGEPMELVDKLRGDGARRLYVDGGDVIRQFLQASLIDELILSVVPVLLGSGIRLFEGDGIEQALELVGTKHWVNGMVQSHYRVVRGEGG